MWRLRVFWESICRVWYYLPIIWKIRDWDWGFCLELFKHSLIRLEETIRVNGQHTTAKRDSRRVKKAIDMIDKILEDDFCKLEFSEFYSRFPNDKWPREYTEEQSKELMRLMNKEWRLKRAAWRRLWVYIEKHMQTWWN